MKINGKRVYDGTDGHPFTNLFWKMAWVLDKYPGQKFMAEVFFDIANKFDGDMSYSPHIEGIREDGLPVHRGWKKVD